MDYYNYFSTMIASREQKRSFFSNRFNFLIKNYHNYIKCNELPMNTSMTYLFEHIDRSIILILIKFMEGSKRNDLLIYDYQNDTFRNALYDILDYLDCKSLILLFFLNVNYFLVPDRKKNILDNMNFLVNKEFKYKDISELSYNIFASSIQPLYFQSYKNTNNRNMFEKRRDFYLNICPDLEYDGVKNRQIDKQNRMKVGFISDSLCKDSSVLRDKIGLIQNLDRDKYEVFIISWRDMEDSKAKLAKKLYLEFKNEYIKLPVKLNEARSEIEKLELDVLIYGEIGMDSRLYSLAFSKLAPIQINTWGHSDTSGLNTIDYFISSEYFEIDNAQKHYTEKLVKFKSLSTYYYKPTSLFLEDYEKKDREFFDLKETDNIYGCIQVSFKISEEFENVLAKILEKDSNAIIILSNNIKFCKSHLSRIKEKFGENYSRIKIFGNMKQELYLNLVSLCDVLLDPYPFGGCNTSFEGFDFNIPVVTLPTNFINGRFTYGLYKKMEIDSCIAKNLSDYSDLAYKLGTNTNFRETISDTINSKKYLIFEEKESLNEWDSFLQSLKN